MELVWYHRHCTVTSRDPRRAQSGGLHCSRRNRKDHCRVTLQDSIRSGMFARNGTRMVSQTLRCDVTRPVESAERRPPLQQMELQRPLSGYFAG
ncbi:hypothetical protein NDU88_004934 [Pleurodeles waltl]|uniref:Uncharacterized protein n=1 Tax=Pleurodeles waltl TaxID=8319 RepID=A0AAV7LN51_PLEWA|nr:hypothetical protein NDU88_004934 [Pleurodeles waltl]